MPEPIRPLQITAHTATTALGAGMGAMRAAVEAEQGGLRPNTFGPTPLPTWVGEVDGLDAPLPASLAPWDCRNHRLAWLGLNADGFV
ncbi:MAG TPA: beta-ketoacyl-[acyl-carrier-protein] synthase II, partial [Burkholderiaceae bacterium]